MIGEIRVVDWAVVEITNKEELEGWLEGQGRAAGVAIAARAVLRVVPLTTDFIVEEPSLLPEFSLLRIFRELGDIWAISAWPNRREDIHLAFDPRLRPDGSYIYTSASGYDNELKQMTLHGTEQFFTEAAIAVSKAAQVGVAAAAKFNANDFAAGSAALTTYAADIEAGDYSSVAGAEADQNAGVAGKALWREITADAGNVEAGISTEIMMRYPLWNVTDIGQTKKWEILKPVLLAFDEDWQVWTGWYEDRLRGADHPDSRPLIEDLELKRSLIPDEEWHQGPKHVNAMIAELEAEYRHENGNNISKNRPQIAIHAEGRVDLGDDAQQTPTRLNLVAGERPTILSNPNGIARDSVHEPLGVSVAALEDLKEVLDGYVSQDAVSEDVANTNKIVLPMAEEDLAILRHYIEAGIQEAKAPRVTQMSVDLFDYDRILLSQSQSIFEAANDVAGKYQPLILAIAGVITALGSTIAAIAAVAALG